MLRIIRPAAFLLAIACLLPWAGAQEKASFGQAGGDRAAQQ